MSVECRACERDLRNGHAEDCPRRFKYREQLAALAHEQWSGWMRYMFSKCHKIRKESKLLVVIPPEFVERWRRQMATPYADLPPNEQESDREEADRMLAITNATAEQEREELRDTNIELNKLLTTLSNGIGELQAEVERLRAAVADLSKEYHSAINEPEYAGTRADWIARCQTAEVKVDKLLNLLEQAYQELRDERPDDYLLVKEIKDALGGGG